MGIDIEAVEIQEIETEYSIGPLDVLCSETPDGYLILDSDRENCVIFSHFYVEACELSEYQVLEKAHEFLLELAEKRVRRVNIEIYTSDDIGFSVGETIPNG